jgi:hypothetical protein
MEIENYENLNGEPMVKIINEDGSCICFTEAQYADYLAAQEAQSL